MGNVDVPVILLAVGGGAVAIVIVVGVMMRRLKKKRRRKLRRVAKSMNFSFTLDGRGGVPKSVDALYLFNQGHSHRFRNVMRGKANGIDVAIFDYGYVIGIGDHASTYDQTVILFLSPSLSLPAFSLRPEEFFDKIASVLGYEDIDFGTHPEFSKRYLLKAEDENMVRKVFTDDVLEFYTKNEELHTEGTGDHLVFYRPDENVEPEEIQQFMEEGFGVFALFQSRT
ncbi:MAG: hypothetical protein HQ582_34635 [Planctomycetes bacterium]|nr:hypothetical protein [Planctomycetota bacterium]